MKNKRGFSGIEIIGILVAIAAVTWGLVAGVGLVKGYLNDLQKNADRAGYDRAIKETAQRDKTELIDAQSQIAALELEKATAAEAHAQAQAKAKSDHDKEMENAKAETADLLRRIGSGELVLRDPGRGAGQRGAGKVDAIGGGGRGEGGTTAAAAGGSGQALGGGLSKQASEFLLLESARADEVARDLALCWGIARDDRAKGGAPAKTP